MTGKMKERLAIIDGVRTPFCKMGGPFGKHQADDLGAFAVKGLLAQSGFSANDIDEVIIGNGVMPHKAANVSRVVALKSGISEHVPAHTVQRNCASGMQAVTSSANKILADEAEVILAGSCESMSNVPLLFGEKMTSFFAKMMRAKTPMQRLKLFASFRPSWLKPVIALESGLTDYTCGLIMGKTAEILAREFHITRQEQDEFALQSHLKAAAATKEGRFAEEIVPAPVAPAWDAMQHIDDGIRAEQTPEALAKLRPYFERVTGTVTAGNSSQITDGAVATIVMKESKAKALGLKPLGYLLDYSYAALEACRMGLGPVFATESLMRRTDLTMDDFDLVELNEAFAAQVIGCKRAFESDEFARQRFGRDKALGELPMEKLNVNGGAIALGHPVGATGTRLVVTLLKELRRRNLNRGLATLCIGGGQGAALALEVN